MVSIISNDDIIKLIKNYYNKQVIQIKQLGSCQDFNYQLTTTCNNNDNNTNYYNNNDTNNDTNNADNKYTSSSSTTADSNNTLYLLKLSNPLTSSIDQLILQNDVIDYLSKSDLSLIDHIELPIVQRIIIKDYNNYEYIDNNDDDVDKDNNNIGGNNNDDNDNIDDNNCCFNYCGSNVNMNDNNNNINKNNNFDDDNNMKKKTMMDNVHNTTTTSTSNIKVNMINNQIFKITLNDDDNNDDDSSSSNNNIFYYARLFVFIKGKDLSSYHYFTTDFLYRFGYFISNVTYILSLYPHHDHHQQQQHHHLHNATITNHHGIDTIISSSHSDDVHINNHIDGQIDNHVDTRNDNNAHIDNHVDSHSTDNDMQWDLRICEKTINKFLQDDKIRYNNIYLPETKLHFITNIAKKALHELSKYKSLLRIQHIIHGDLALYNIIAQQQSGQQQQQQQQQHQQQQHQSKNSNNDNASSGSSIDSNNSSISNRPSICGIIDFGDLMESWIISDLAISINSVLIHCQSHEEYISVTLTILQGYYFHRQQQQNHYHHHHQQQQQHNDHDSHHNNSNHDPSHQHHDHHHEKHNNHDDHEKHNNNDLDEKRNNNTNDDDDHDVGDYIPPLLEEEIMALWPLIILRSINNILSNIYELTYSNNNNNIYVIDGIHEDWQTLVNLNRINMYFAQECCRNAVNLKPSIRIAQNNNKSSKYSLLGNSRSSSSSSSSATTTTTTTTASSSSSILTSTFMTRTGESVIMIDYSPESDVYVDGNWLDESFIDKQHHQYQYHQYNNDHDHNKIYMTTYGQCNLYLTQTHSLKELPIYNLFVNLYLQEGREFMAPYDGKVQINYIPIDEKNLSSLTFICTSNIGINIIISGVEEVGVGVDVVVVDNNHINNNNHKSNNQYRSFKAGEVFAKVVAQKKKKMKKTMKKTNKIKNKIEDIIYTKCSVQISTVIKSSGGSSSSKNNNNNVDDDDDDTCGSRNSTNNCSNRSSGKSNDDVNKSNSSSSIDNDDVIDFIPPRYCTHSMLNYWKVISPSPYELLFGSNVITPQYHHNQHHHNDNDVDDDNNNQKDDHNNQNKVDECNKWTSYNIDKASKDNYMKSSATANTSQTANFSIDSSTVDIIHNSNNLITSTATTATTTTTTTTFTTTTTTTAAAATTNSTTSAKGYDINDDSLQKRYNYVAKVQEHYFKKPPQMIRGWKEFIYDNNGRAYLDMVNNVTVVGHSHPTIAKVAYKQLQLLNTNSRFNYNILGEYAKKIINTLPLNCSSSLDCVIFVNSGSEATDLALRIARTVVSERRKKASLSSISPVSLSVESSSQPISSSSSSSSSVAPSSSSSAAPSSSSSSSVAPSSSSSLLLRSRDTICLEGAYHGVTTASDEVSTTLNDNPQSRDSRPSWIHLVPMPNRFRGKHLQASRSSSSSSNESSTIVIDNDDVDAAGNDAGGDVGVVNVNNKCKYLNTKHCDDNDNDGKDDDDDDDDHDHDKSIFVDVDDSPDILYNNNNDEDDNANSNNTKSINVINSNHNNIDYNSDEYMVEYYASYVEKLIEKLILQNKTPVAFIAEPLSGNAGGVEIPYGYLLRVIHIIHKIGGLYISDEVQVGYGRLGNVFWGFEEHNIIPDIITMAKAAGNGYPLGYVITNKDIINEFNIIEGSFFSSSGGSPCSCIIGYTVLQIIKEDELQYNAFIVGNYLHNKLIQLSKQFKHIIGYIHGHGLYQGIELIKNGNNNNNNNNNSSSSSSSSSSSGSSSSSTTLPIIKEPATKEAYAICERLLELGVICHNTGDYSNVLKVKPPLVFTKESADFFIEALTIALQGW